MVTSYFFGLLGATYAVYTVLFPVFLFISSGFLFIFFACKFSLFYCEGVVVAMIQIVSSLLLLILLLLLFMLPPNLVCIYNAFHFDGFGFAAGVS